MRDQDGRTYAGATVDLPTLQLTAVQVAVAMAVTSGARSLEAVVVLGDAAVVNEADLSVVRDLSGAAVPVHLAAPDGTLVASRGVLAPLVFRTRRVPVHARRL